MEEEQSMERTNMKSSDIFSKISSIKLGKKDYYDSNIFFVPEEIDRVIFNEHALVYLWNDKGVRRVYFAANDAEALRPLLEEMPSKSGIEMIGKQLNHETETVILDAGYRLFETYARASIYNLKEDVYKNIPDKYKEIDIWDIIQYAERKHAQDIYDLLYDTFDPFTSHLPSLDQILEDIDRRNVVVVTEDDHVRGFIIFKVIGKKVYIEQIINRGKSVYMHALYMGVLEKAMADGINIAYSWVKEGNERAYALMRRYSYQWEGIKNFAYRKEQ